MSKYTEISKFLHIYTHMHTQYWSSCYTTLYYIHIIHLLPWTFISIICRFRFASNSSFRVWMLVEQSPAQNHITSINSHLIDTHGGHILRAHLLQTHSIVSEIDKIYLRLDVWFTIWIYNAFVFISFGFVAFQLHKSHWIERSEQVLKIIGTKFILTLMNVNEEIITFLFIFSLKYMFS